jgi:hypothetical protein
MNQKFAEAFWQTIIGQPLGSLTKRELELMILDCAIKTSVLDREPHNVARTFHISMSKAHTYLNDIALREPEISDEEALIKLNDLLKSIEITNEANYLVIPINDARLRIWLEREMSALKLSAGETIRRDLIRISPYSLLKLLKETEKVLPPFESLKMLKEEFGEDQWYKNAVKNWKKETTWESAIKGISINLASENISTLVSLFKAAICQLV